MKIPKLTKELLDKVVSDRCSRQEITAQNHFWFLNVYFSHYIKYPFADFHREILQLTEQKDITNLIIVAFRGSGKSTIMNMSYPIWSIISGRKKFVLIVGKTQEQAKQHIKNLKSELENNSLLKADFGRFEEPDGEWRATSIVLPKYDAQITAISVDQSIRGLRYKEHRPDLIICDDIEDLNSVRTQESRNKIFDWVTSDLIPAGDVNTQMVMIGNLLHRDSVLMRMRDKIEAEEIDGIFREFKLFDANGEISWKGKYPNMEAVEKERKRVADDKAWEREYLLKIVTSDDAVISDKWIRFYKKEDLERAGYCRSRVLGIDLAISKKDSADYTAMVWIAIHGYGKDMKIFVLPNPINARLTFGETMAMVTAEVDRVQGYNCNYKIAVENVAYQQAAIDQLQELKYKVIGVAVRGQDKRSRLSIAASRIQSGQVLFPEHGCEDLINQLVGFGAEKHDDLADAFSTAMLSSSKELGLRIVKVRGRNGVQRLLV